MWIHFSTFSMTKSSDSPFSWFSNLQEKNHIFIKRFHQLLLLSLYIYEFNLSTHYCRFYKKYNFPRSLILFNSPCQEFLDCIFFLFSNPQEEILLSLFIYELNLSTHCYRFYHLLTFNKFHSITFNKFHSINMTVESSSLKIPNLLTK